MPTEPQIAAQIDPLADPLVDKQTGLTAIREAAAFCAITDRAFLRISGPDATRWLNGMVTNNIKDLAPGAGNYNFLLNAQGRIQGDCTIYRDTDEDGAAFLLETQTSQLETVRQTLDQFIIMDDVELTPMHDRAGIHLLGPDASSLLAAIDLRTEELQPLELVKITWNSTMIDLIRTHGVLVPQYEIWAESKVISSIGETLMNAKAQVVTEEALEAFRIYSGTPKYGTDIRERDLPQETGQTHALHFAKGCYLGQEIVERIRSRGQVHRTFTQFILDGDFPTLPAPLTANEKAAGELTSATRIGDTLYALGYLRRELLESHTPITYPGGTAAPRT